MEIDCYISPGCGTEEALKENIARLMGEVIRYFSGGAFFQHEYEHYVTDHRCRHEDICNKRPHCSRSFQCFKIICRQQEKGISGRNHYFPYTRNETRKTNEPIRTSLTVDNACYSHLRSPPIDNTAYLLSISLIYPCNRSIHPPRWCYNQERDQESNTLMKHSLIRRDWLSGDLSLQLIVRFYIQC